MAIVLEHATEAHLIADSDVPGHRYEEAREQVRQRFLQRQREREASDAQAREQAVERALETRVAASASPAATTPNLRALPRIRRSPAPTSSNSSLSCAATCDSMKAISSLVNPYRL